MRCPTRIQAAWLVLPTYNEAENIEAFVAAGAAKLPASAQVLIVDDNSPDGTGEIADRLAERHENVSVLHRPRKEGLGPAYVAGFRRALAGGAGLVLEMDSDFSHDPAYLPRLLEAARAADLVLGSRYVPGRRRQRLGAAAAGDQPRRQRLRPARARGRRPGPDRRLQVLPPRGAGGDRPRRDPGRAATPSRSR